jgi:uncharacterized protein (TIGR00251 family)
VTPDPPPVKQDGADVLLTLRIQPRAARNQLLQRPDGLILRLIAPPVEGAANAACLAYLAEVVGCPRSTLAIVRGETARRKQIRIRNASAAHVLARLAPPVAS